MVNIARPEGNHGPNIRRLKGIGRYGEWERNIELQNGRYVSLGTDSRIEFNKAVALIRSILPESPDTGLTKKNMLELRQGTDTEISGSTLDRALTWMVREGEVGRKQMMNARGKPIVFWKAATV